ncbi:MAG: FAD-dependent monooxygenase, partial [Candidatus Hydrogenedentes bacterium]|nr:FAD-dependent monooxygenase [Candidatus Hydrogenedentota bacterium]
LAREGLFLALPLPHAGWYRVVVNTLRPDQDVAENDLRLGHFQRWLENRTHHPDARIVDSIWMSRFRISRRIISQFRTGPIFFAGDAAHVHSPAGGQGMNTGIQDAVNLAWKLAAVLSREAPDRLLDSYETERRPVAEAVLKATDRLTRAATVQLGAAQWARTAAAHLMLRSKRLQRYALQRLAELTVCYPASPLNFEGGVGPRPGQRAPDGCVEPASAPSPTRLYDCFHPTHWQLLAFDGRTGDWASDETLNGLIASHRESISVLYLHREQGDHPQHLRAYRDASGAVFKAYGADRPVLVLVRPDRYIAGAVGPASMKRLREYLECWIPE